MDGEGVRRLPGIFIAYPSDRQCAEGMRRLAQELRDQGADVRVWEEFTRAGFLFDPIAQAIDASGLVLAEVTSCNGNVLFEAGFSIGRGKPFYWLKNDSVAEPIDLPPLRIVRGIPYTLRGDIIEFLDSVDGVGPAIAEQVGLSSGVSEGGRLYFIPSPNAGDLNEAIWQLCDSSAFSARRIDHQDSDYDSLTSQARSIAEADVVVTLLVAADRKDARISNGQVMLYAGIAAGLDKDFVVLAEQPQPGLLDLGDHILSIRSEAEAEFGLKRWLDRTTSSRLKSPPPKRSVIPSRASKIEGLFFGSLDASADFQLSSYFIRTPEFSQAERGERHLFVGAKGSGKTANFVQLQERFLGSEFLVVTVAPAEFEFPRLAAVFDEYLDLAHWEFIYGSFWRFILVTEVIRRVQEEAFDHLLRESEAAYARGLMGWIDDNRSLLAKDFASRVGAVLSEIESIRGTHEQRRSALEDLLQTARMYDMEGHLKELGRRFQVRLLVDDLDRNWSPEKTSAQRLVTAFLSEVESLMKRLAPSLKPSIFIRRDVFTWLERNDPEILKRDPGSLRWDRQSLENLIGHRILVQVDSSETDPSALWLEVFPQRIRGERTQDFIISRTLLRPRDVVQFCQKALETAQRAGRESIAEEDVYEAWEASGQQILAQAETEYQARYPGLGSLVLGLFEGPARMHWEEALSRLSQVQEPGMSAYDEKSMLEMLYETGVVGVCTASGESWFEVDRSLAGLLPVLPVDFEIVVHPAFQRYLRCV